MTQVRAEGARRDELVLRVLRWAEAAPESATALVVANLVPLIGVLAFGWSLMLILVLYWVENGIVGLLNVPKMALARGPVEARTAILQARIPLFGPGMGRTLALAFIVPFFLVHYGIFWLGHGIFVFLLPTMVGAASGGDLGPGTVDRFEIAGVDPVIVLSAAALLLASHLLSFWRNYVGRREYLAVSPINQMAAPYARVVILHVTILLGGFASMAVGAPVVALAVLVLLKTAIDLRAHLREHAKPGR